MMGERLTALDASFLAAERPDLPLHIGGLAVFEGDPVLTSRGELRLDDIHHLVRSRLDFVPRFRRRVLEAPFGLGLPQWVDAHTFDVADHVRVERLPAPGTREALLDMATELLAEPLARDRPLWEMVFIEGLPDRQVALVSRIHHALVDGVSGAESLILLVDPDPDAEPGRPRPWDPELPPSVAGQLGGLAIGTARSALSTANGLLRAVTSGGRGATEAVGSFRSSGLAPSCSLNQPVGPRRRYVPLIESLAEVKQAAKAHGAKVNDVVLAAVTRGLRDLLAGRGELSSVESVHTLVPMSIRSDDERLALGNRVSSLTAELPVREADPLARLAQIAEQMTALKQSNDTEAMAGLLGTADWWPSPVVTLVSRLIVDRQPFVNTVVTNIPGPQMPLYMLGARLLELDPYVPLGGNLTVGVAVVSYDGMLSLGITSDPDAAPDADVLETGIGEGFRELLG